MLLPLQNSRFCGCKRFKIQDYFIILSDRLKSWLKISHIIVNNITHSDVLNSKTNCSEIESSLHNSFFAAANVRPLIYNDNVWQQRLLLCFCDSERNVSGAGELIWRIFIHVTTNSDKLLVGRMFTRTLSDESAMRSRERVNLFS